MKFSFFMMPLHLPTENPSLAFDRDLDIVRYAEELGYDEFYLGEHHSAAWETIPAPDMFLAKASAVTSTIKLGTAVVSAPFHHPFHLAERFAFLDHLSRGRVVLGLGPCGLAPDVKLFNIPPARLRSMLQESVDIIARLLESPEPITYEGKYWTLREMRLQLRSYQQPRLPLASVTSGSPASLAMGGQYGMKVFSPIVPPGLPLKEQFPHIEEAAEKHGQKISREDWRAATYVYLADTREQAWADVRTGIERDVHDYFYTINGERAWADYPGQPKSELTAERIAEKRGWIIGTPDDAIERLEQLNEETGGIGGILITTHEWVPHWKSRYSMELFARYVMPHFRGHTADLRDEWERTKRDRADGAIPEILGRDLSSEFPKGGDSTNLRVGI